MIFPDNPKAVSHKYLRELDRAPVGTYWAQPKLDGWRRILHVDDKHIQVQTKRGAERRHLPPHLLTGIPAIDGLSLDCEWIGPRRDAARNMPADKLYVFDVLRYEGEWLRDMPFFYRMQLLEDLKIEHVEAAPNPYMHDLLVAQLVNPISEGIVVRRGDSGLVLSETACRDNPSWVKIRLVNGSRIGGEL